MKTYIIVAHDGTEVIDCTPEADFRLSAMDYAERRYKRSQRWKLKSNETILKKLILKMPLFCSIM